MNIAQRFDERPTLPLVAAGTHGVEGLLRRLEVAPAMLGRYELRRVLGAGATAVVFDGCDLRLRRRVAVKIAVCDARLDAEYSALGLREEGRILARVDHPYVVRALEWGEAQGLPFLAMTHVSGVDMGRYQAISSPTLEALLSRFADIAEGLAAVHDAGFIHRDIKPSNLLVDLERDCAVICDFGLATPTPSLSRRTAAWERPDRQRMAVGTVGYRSPEVERGELASEGSDQYAFFVTLVQLLLGSSRAKQVMDLQARGRERAARKCLAGFPQELVDLMLRGLRSIPEARAGSMHLVAERLRGLVGVEPPTGTSLAA